MSKQSSTPCFAIFIKADDTNLFTLGSVYKVLPDESAAKSNCVRIVDSEGEEYLYPADYFLFVEFPQEVQRSSHRAAHPKLQDTSLRQRGSTTQPRKTARRGG